MALPSSGAIALSDIQTEFGGANPISISEYYRGTSVGLVTFTNDTNSNANIPTSPGSTISWSNFYGAKVGYPTIVNRTNNATGGTGSPLSIGVPASRQSGDILLLVSAHSYYDFDFPSGYGPTPTTGWTRIYDLTAKDDFESPNFVAWWKVSNGTETSISYTTSGSSNNSTCAAVFVIRDVNTTTPFQSTAAITRAYNTTSTISFGSVTPSYKGGLLLCLAAQGSTGTITTAGVTQNISNFSASDYRDIRLAYGTYPVGTAQSIGSAFTPSSWVGNSAHAAVSFSLLIQPK